jgi:Fic family protein
VRVVPPPTLSELPVMTNKVIDEYLAEYRRKNMPYLHYDQLRHRVTPKEKLDTLWRYLKIMRRFSAFWLRPLNGVGLDGPEIVNMTATIQKSCSIVDRLASSAAETERYEKFDAADYLMDELRAAESIASSQLEGAATTSRVALEMIKVGRKPRDESERMIMGNWRMMEYVTRHSDQRFNLQSLLDLHRIGVVGIDDEKYAPGQLRQEGDDVVVVDHEGQVLHTPPPAAILENALVRLSDFINTPHEIADDETWLHPLVKACIIHFTIGWLHPFKDGNGRVARALFYGYMLKCGYTAFRYISVSKLLKNAPAQYVRAYLYTETDDMDLTYFVDYQCGVVSRAVREYIEYIQGIVETRSQLKQWLYDTGVYVELNARQRDLAAIAINQPGVLFTAAEVKARMKVSENTARADLNKLTRMGLMRALKEGKGNVWLSPHSLNELKKWRNRAEEPRSTQDW